MLVLVLMLVMAIVMTAAGPLSQKTRGTLQERRELFWRNLSPSQQKPGTRGEQMVKTSVSSASTRSGLQAMASAAWPQDHSQCSG